MNFEQYDTEELASWFSDYHKDVHGIRPRWVDHTDRVAIIDGIQSLDRYMYNMKSTPEGRAQLRADGWVVDEDGGRVHGVAPGWRDDDGQPDEAQEWHDYDPDC